MNDSILEEVVAKLTVDQPMAVIFKDGGVHYPYLQGVVRKGDDPRCKTTPHIEVVKRPGMKAWVSQMDITSVDREHCIAILVYGDEDSVACMTKDENYAHGFAFGSTEKAFHLLGKAE